MSFKQKKPRFEVGDLVQFKKLKKTRLSGPDSWIDADENFISPGSFALIVARDWVTLDDGACWEYDVSVPELGIISRGWGDYAFGPIQNQEEKK